MFRFFKSKRPKSDPYGIAPWPPAPGSDHIDCDPIPVTFAQQVADQRFGRFDKPLSQQDRQSAQPSFAPNDPVYWAGLR